MLSNFRNPYIVLLILSVLALYFAYFVEYIMGLSACPLCIYQRFPYLIFIGLSIVAISEKQSQKYNIYLIVTAFISIILAGYHSGVERGIFEMSSFCKPLISITNNLSVSDFKKILYGQELGLCNKPALVIFSLSMTEWNLLFNLALFTIFFMYRNYNNR
jgi:disulfide bond formation protein DsbB